MRQLDLGTSEVAVCSTLRHAEDRGHGESESVYVIMRRHFCNPDTHVDLIPPQEVVASVPLERYPDLAAARNAYLDLLLAAGAHVAGLRDNPGQAYTPPAQPAEEPAPDSE